MTYGAVYSNIGPLQSSAVWLGSTENHAVIVDKSGRICGASQTAFYANSRVYASAARKGLISLIPPRSPGSAKPCPSNNWDTRQRPLISSKEFTVLELVVKVPVTTLLKQCKLIIKCKLWLKSLAELVYYKVKPTVLLYVKSNYSGMSFCSVFFAVQEGQAATSFKFSSCRKNAEKMLKLCAIPIPDHHPYEMFTYILS